MRRLRSEDRALLLAYAGPEPKRVRAAIVSLVHGDTAELRVLVRAAQKDYRDVLWWEEQRREGTPAKPVDVDRLVEWLEAPPRPQPAEASRVSVVLLDAGPADPGLLKEIRRASGTGLADVAALLAQVPVTIVEGLGRGDAEALQARMLARGARVELR